MCSGDLKMKKRFRTKIGCTSGHPLKDVTIRRVTNPNKGTRFTRYRCASCGAKLDISFECNLIGNPFDIVELSDAYRDKKVLDSIDNVFV